MSPACHCPTSILQLYPEHRCGFIAQSLHFTWKQLLFLKCYTASGYHFLRIQKRGCAVTYLLSVVRCFVFLSWRYCLIEHLCCTAFAFFPWAKLPARRVCPFKVDWPNWTLFWTEVRDRRQNAQLGLSFCVSGPYCLHWFLTPVGICSQLSALLLMAAISEQLTWFSESLAINWAILQDGEEVSGQNA